MNYKLVKVNVNGNADRFGGSDSETEIAISTNKEKLEEYCKETYGQSAKKSEKFSWEYYKIVETKILMM